MRIRTGNTTYTKVKNMTFAPQVAITSMELPVNEFAADIVTTDTISEGAYAELRDDLGSLWAKYWIYRAVRLDASTVRVYAHSEIALMDDVDLDEVVYDDEPLDDVLESIMLRQSGAPGIVTPIDYDLDASLEEVTVMGYCPPQTARERLQWVLFACGAYAKTAFNNRPQILPIQDTAHLVPLEQTYYRPTVNVERRVTEIRVTAYTFVQAAQTSTDILSDDTSYTFPLPWKATTQLYKLVNPDATAMDGDNPVEVDELYLVNPGNVSVLLHRLAARYFSRESVDMDVIDNAQHIPGDMVTVYSRADTLYTGFIESASFAFGLQAKAKLKVVAAQHVESAALTILYAYNNKTIRKERYLLPVGYPYEISTVYVDRTRSGTRRIYRPTVAAVTGTMDEAETVQVPCEIALELRNHALTVLSVDEVEVETHSDKAVGVIE